MKASHVTIMAPISVGELIDKITILNLKRTKIKAKDSLTNIRTELSMLEEILTSANLKEFKDILNPLIEALQEINGQLWNVEDDLRVLESKQIFDKDFIHLARSVYKLNDKRALIKKKINESCGSTLVEEKSYEKY